jgi:cysteine synthase
MKNHIADRELSARFTNLWRLVGNSPLLVIHFSFRGEKRTLYTKAEHYNITGSIKDRMALYILQKAYETGQIQPGDTIVEATSGNTGISFSAIGKALGHPVQILMPDWMSRERMEIIRSLGAVILPVTREQGGFLGSIRLSEEMSRDREHIFLPRQFANQANVEAHQETTGPELWWQMQQHGVVPEAFTAGVGTGGTVMGVGRFLRSMNSRTRIFPLEPQESPTLSTGYKVGQHRIQGISDDFIPAIVKLDELQPVVAVSDGDAILMAQKLASQLGLAVGISSGANFLGALKIQNALGSQTTVATVFADSNKKYLSTDLLRAEPARDGYYSPEVQLLSYEVYKRTCKVCCDAESCDQRYGEGCRFRQAHPAFRIPLSAGSRRQGVSQRRTRLSRQVLTTKTNLY